MQRFYLIMPIHVGWNFRKGQEQNGQDKAKIEGGLQQQGAAEGEHRTEIDHIQAACGIEAGESSRPASAGRRHNDCGRYESHELAAAFSAWVLCRRRAEETLISSIYFQFFRDDSQHSPFC
jgi:hypothetical protein